MAGSAGYIQHIPKLLLLGLAGLVTAGCGDRAASPVDVEDRYDRERDVAAGAVAMFRCDVTVQPGHVACFAVVEGEPAAGLAYPRSDGAPAVAFAGSRVNVDRMPARAGIAAYPVSPARTLGGQGTYVRLASSNVTFTDGIFSFDATVQNLSNLPMATADGTARHDAGIRVFFHTGPVATVGSGSVSVSNPTAVGAFTATNQPYFQYGGRIGGLDQDELGDDGILASAEVSEPKRWELELHPGVDFFSFTVLVWTETPPGELATVAPHVTGVSPGTLVPGATATLTGSNFDPTPENNVVMVGNAQAPVTGGDTGHLVVTVPCILSGTVPVSVTAAGMTGAAVARPLVTNTHALAPGEAVVLSDAEAADCNELAPTGEASRYVLAVYNTSGSAAATTAFELSADGTPDVAPAAPPAAAASPAARDADPPVDADLMMRDAAQAAVRDALHHDLLRRNAREYERLFHEFSGDPRMRQDPAVLAGSVEPPLTATMRVPNLNSNNFCVSHFVVTATRVYYSGKLAIYEDDATPTALRAANNPTMAAYYQAIGDQYNEDMESIVRERFGDVLVRDADTDNNGVLIALFTPLVNTQFSGVLGFVVSCDQFPQGSGNLSSNFGEYVYLHQPTNNNSGFTTGTPHQWYRIVRATLIHEAKHVASMAARVANASPVWESMWLEEGTARLAEELWARISVYEVPWKGNTGYGNPPMWNSIYCDVRSTSSTCSATNPRRPSQNMWRHFSVGALYRWLGNSRTSSPFGVSAADAAAGAPVAFYASSWSLVRYAIDRFAADEGAFLTELNQATTSGIENLTARAGVSIEELLGGWALALYASDYPGLASPSPIIQMPTWDFESIYSGFQTDFPGTYTRSRHAVPAAELGFGPLSPVAFSGLVGGGVVYFEFSGEHAGAQLLRLTGHGGGALPATVRAAVARLE